MPAFFVLYVCALVPLQAGTAAENRTSNTERRTPNAGVSGDLSGVALAKTEALPRPPKPPGEGGANAGSNTNKVVLGKNLVSNGSFANEEEPLKDWQFLYTGNENYAKNHTYITVEKEVDGHKDVLSLFGPNNDVLNNIGYGVKVDSKPIPVPPGGRYRLSLDMKSTGPAVRVLAEGYRWKPGIKPYDNPILEDLRKCFKGSILLLNDAGGSMARPGSTWVRGSVAFPKEDLSEMGQEKFDEVKFLVIHIVAIGGSPGYLYIDNVELERIKK